MATNEVVSKKVPEDMSESKFRLAIVSSHPIQYNAPFFRLLAQEGSLQVKVFYTWSQSQQGKKFDPGFNRSIEWDIPLLDGYEYTFVENISKDPGTHHFKGIENPTLIAEIKNWKADALLIFGWSFKSHLACLRYFKNKTPIIFRGDSNLLDEQAGIKKILRRIFLKWVYVHVDYALYVGTNNKRYFQVHGLKERQLFFAPHAVDNERFWNDEQLRQSEANTWRENLGIGERDFLILFAGKLEPVKNPEYILRLASEISDEHIKFLIVGNGPLENDFKSKAKHDKRIIFVDFQNQQRMPAVYRMADTYILPSNGETWGLAINEAMACSRPIIVSSKAGCAIDLIRDGENGIIIDISELNSCIQYINSLKSDKNKKLAAGSASKNIITGFSFSKIVDAVTGLISDKLKPKVSTIKN